MAKVYADLVEAGYYTLDPEKVVEGSVKLVPASIADRVRVELESRGYFDK